MLDKGSGHQKCQYRLRLRSDCYIPVAVTLAKILNPKQKEDLTILGDQFLEYLLDSQVKIIMYGTKQERDLIDEIVLHAQNNNHMEMYPKAVELMNSVRGSLRKELKIDA